MPNEVGGRETTAPEQVSEHKKELLDRYTVLKSVTLDDIIAFHVEFERYYRGLQNWSQERGWLTDTILSAQDQFKAYLDYFRIPYEN